MLNINNDEGDACAEPWPLAVAVAVVAAYERNHAALTCRSAGGTIGTSMLLRLAPVGCVYVGM